MKLRSNKSLSGSLMRQTLFSGLAILLIVILGIVVVYSTTFIIKSSESALDISSVESAPQQRFDIQGYDKLELVKQKK